MAISEVIDQDGYRLETNPHIRLLDPAGNILIQLVPGISSLGGGVVMVRDSAGDFRSLGVYINPEFTDIAQESNIRILDSLFERLRRETKALIHIAAYGPFFGLDPEGRRQVLYLGGMDIALLTISKSKVTDVMLLDPFDSGSQHFSALVERITGTLIQGH
ncbi:hypothetical protein PP187_gp213 [Klebsiella phage vB_KvM-Eowyn]|uniref:Uncharacterized protein n=1 Tax=Klebsiella phage vB_KvM-Eowyn TaxID=2762819 RepID=A0A7R8MJK8_9CAUD|nr:hypothetical protein PP187_gp213 [Klebsiella phage vB_KvM-Eowyn]CAD5236202.1 hypothetical protein LLCLJKAH_00213 [Klebsiella phage vB_KvM-Eowyn]